jgi:deoxyribodipyrimidine photolyase-related protein
MSDYCAGCAYSPKVKQGPRACPFNDLYWAFLIRNARALSRNPRLTMPYRTLAGWDGPRKDGIVARADRFLDGLPTGYPASMASPAP